MSHPGARLAIAAAILAAAIAAIAAIAGFGIFAGDGDEDDARLASLQQVALPGNGDEGNARLAALQQVVLPEDGLPLYQALLREIPDVVAEVPCACCAESLEWCYTGGCPPG